MRNLKQIIEQLSELKDQRKNIVIQRLAYLKYADETKGNNNFKDLYNLLFNFLFDEYGNVRDNKNLYDYIDKLIKDNNGTIPNLPNNGTIETIDKKIKALDELEPSTLKKYIKEVENEASSKQKSENSKSDDSLTNDMSDDELKEKIGNIIDTEGFTNILGLESSRKMSDIDKQKIKDKEENIKDNIPDNGEKESESGEELNPKLEKQLDKLSDEDLEDLEDLDDSDFQDLDEVTPKEKEKKESLEFLSICDYMILESETSAVKKEERKRKFRSILAKQLNDHPAAQISSLIQRKRTKNMTALLNKRIEDAEGEEKEKLERQKNALVKTSFDENGNFIGDPLARKAREKQLMNNGDISKDDLISRKDKKQLRLDAKAFVNTDEGKSYLKNAKDEIKTERENQSSGLNDLKRKEEAIEKDKNKEELKAEKERKKEEAKKEKEFQKEFDKEKRKEDRENRKNERRFKREEKQKQKEEEKQKKEEEYQEWKKKKLANQEEPAKESDEVAKAEDGTEIHKRKKENSDGYTYVRIKDGKEVGYASEEDFQNAQKRKAEQQTESLKCISLINFICS